MPPTPHDGRPRRAVTTILALLMLPVMIAFLAFVVDMGWARMVHAQLQAAADAASFGAARELDGTEAGMTRAVEVALLVASLNDANGSAVDLEAEDITLGVWDEDARTFTPSTDAAAVDAVQVLAARDDLWTPLSFVVFGTEELSTTALSIATRGRSLGAGSVPYYLPLGIPKCKLDAASPDELYDEVFVLNPAGVDNVGWAAVGQSPNASWTRDFVDAALDCMLQWSETGTITEDCGASASTAERLGMGTGEATSALRYIVEAIPEGPEWDEETWGELPARNEFSDVPEDEYGHMLVGPMPVFDGGSEYCEGGGSWTGTAPISGFVWAAIYDGRWKGSAAEKNLWVRIDPTRPWDVGSWYGGGNYGVTFDGPPVVVR